MPVSKRLLDLGLVLLLAPLLVPAAAAVALVLRIADGAPILHGSERIGQGGRAFTLWKFRTMRPDPESGPGTGPETGPETDPETGGVSGGVTGGDKAARITPLGRRLRRLRLDELPQIWNVLAGEMSLVGPRPPLRRYVDRFPALYAEVLAARPGITGLATLVFHRREEVLLAACASADETDAVYARRCVPVKARLDLIYRRRWSLGLDLRLLAATLGRVLSRRG